MSLFRFFKEPKNELDMYALLPIRCSSECHYLLRRRKCFWPGEEEKFCSAAYNSTFSDFPPCELSQSGPTFAIFSRTTFV